MDIAEAVQRAHPSVEVRIRKHANQMDFVTLVQDLAFVDHAGVGHPTAQPVVSVNGAYVGGLKELRLMVGTADDRALPQDAFQDQLQLVFRSLNANTLSECD